MGRVYLLVLVLMTGAFAHALPPDIDVTNELRQFHENPAVYMQKLPPKWSNSAVFESSKFSSEQIENRDYILAKDHVRQNVCTIRMGHKVCPQTPHQLRSAPGFNRELMEAQGPGVEEILEGFPTLRDIREMDKFKSQSVSMSPWSDSYWPLYRGALGNRYADPDFPSSIDWLTNFNYAKELDPFTAENKDRLSPSEKYDLLVGDRQKSLTRAMWDSGRYYYDSYGKVETWMGLCHGWAPASYKLSRPNRALRVRSADGTTEIKFYPSDIKALATLLWANAQTSTLFVGGRCNDKNPPVDENGRILSPQCFDTNPGTWHLALINRIRANLPFVFDASFDYEVWNQPVLGYSYRYFNPQTMAQNVDLDNAIIPIETYTLDKFKKYRAPNTKYLVGIALQVKYLSETDPNEEEIDDPSSDSILFAHYLYDLELDENFNVIGGEWYHNAHPDFIWTPSVKTRALALGDYAISDSWTSGESTPAHWLAPAQRSSRYGQPLANIVERLIEWAQ